MPSVKLTEIHDLGKPEAERRLREKFGHALAQFEGQVTDVTEQWNDGQLEFGFRVMGMKISGNVAVGDSAVHLTAELPMAAMLFKGTIESRLRAELAQVLA
ncbi:MAG: polyhydroxyalkanoic acid system family protein [Planctomycetota bacterium]